MHADGWYLTDDIDHFLARAGGFLRSRPALHNTPLTALEKLRTGAEPALFGRWEHGGEVRALFYRAAARRLYLTPLPSEQADTLAARLADLGQDLPGVTADHDSATAFAAAWRRRTGRSAEPDVRIRLYRLGTPVPPKAPRGRARAAGAADREQVVRWCRDFCVDVGEQASIDAIDAGNWSDTRFGDKHFTFWETPDGAPAAMAGSTAMVAGMVRVDPVFTPSHLRGHGYAGALTAEVGRVALAAGATDVVLFADPGNPTSTALYERIGYVPLAEFTAYCFA